MKPPICCVCGRHDDSAASLVSFADLKALPSGMTGHPVGLEWICSLHVEQARKLSRLKSKEAIEQLRRRGPLTGMLTKLLD